MCAERRVFPKVLKSSQIHFIMNLKSFSKFPKNLLAEAKHFFVGRLQGKGNLQCN